MPTNELTEVRPARPDEYEIVADLCVAAYGQSGQLRADDPYEAVLRDAEGRARDARLLVAVRDERVVGTVTICPTPSPFSEISVEGESEFRFLAVAPEAWRSGVGESLVAACEDWARDNGRRQQVICVKTDNASAHRMYARLGFTRIPDRDWTPQPDVHLQAYARPVPWQQPPPTAETP